SCCRPSDDLIDGKKRCLGDEYGEKCLGGDAYCYNEICEPNPATEEGDLCGTEGGKCLPKGTIGKRDTGGRDCGTLLDDLVCIIKNNDLPPSLCKNKEDATECGISGFCYDEKCETTIADLGEKCGDKKEAKCMEGEETIVSSEQLGDRYYYNCPTGSIIGGSENAKGTPGRECDPNDKSILCCAPPEKKPYLEPIDLSSLMRQQVDCDADSQPSEGDSSGLGLFKGSIVPCGRHCNDPNTPGNEMEECTLCHFIIMGKRIYDLLLSWLVVISILMITAGGILYMFSGANQNLNSLAKEIIKKTLIGFALFIGSWLIVSAMLMLISANTSFLGSGTNWYEFSCETISPFTPKSNNSP
ncbi:MAG: pilin, partial [Patescibacteria group bacterium]|nr:pilin [Patescibacteria group bacterium]